MTARQPRPKAYCPECGTISVYSEHINRRCAKTWEVPSEVIEGETETVRCEGRFKGAVASDNWVECAECRATGFVGEEACARCGGAGWRYVGART